MAGGCFDSTTVKVTVSKAPATAGATPNVIGGCRPHAWTDFELEVSQNFLGGYYVATNDSQFQVNGCSTPKVNFVRGTDSAIIPFSISEIGTGQWTDSDGSEATDVGWNIDEAAIYQYTLYIDEDVQPDGYYSYSCSQIVDGASCG